MPSVNSATESLKSNAKSFALAAKILPKDKYETVARLYRFCRYADDIADNETTESSLLLLDQLRKDLEVEQSSIAAVKDYIQIRRKYDIPKSAALDLLDGLENDQSEVRIQSLDELIRYAYRVAGTVGIMMAKVLRVESPRAFPHAIDLGIAMQITNICRDVLEDADQNRVYIPQELSIANLDPITIQDDKNQKDNAWNAIKQLLEIADVYYKSADAGMRFIPSDFRSCIFVAARLYQSIGKEILRRGPEVYWMKRTVVPKNKKLGIVLNSLWQCSTDRTISGKESGSPHQAQLHYPLLEIHR